LTGPAAQRESVLVRPVESREGSQNFVRTPTGSQFKKKGDGCGQAKSRRRKGEKRGFYGEGPIL